MTKLRQQFRDHIVAMFDEILAGSDALDAASDAVAAALAADRIVYVVGSGHSHLLAEEAFYRAGGLAAAQAMLDPDLMLHNGARRSTAIEREPGRAEKIIGDFPVGPGDVVFIASNSGRNAFPIEMAIAAKARGAVTIAITSVKHAQATTARHPSQRRLFELTDIVLDNGGEYGDAVLPVGDGQARMGPTSTIVGAFILDAVLAEAADKVLRRGIGVDIYMSANAENADATVDAIIRRWEPRIRGL